MERIIKIILDFFKQKCPNCNSPMDSIGERFGSKIYGCKICKNEWF